MARTRESHPVDDALLALVEDDASSDAAVREHVAGCPSCAQRVAELGAMRRLLQDVAAAQQHPQHDVAQRAIGRLRLRHKAIGNVNEVFVAVRALIRGFADLFGGGPPPSAPGPTERHDEGASNG